ncbi:Por secretion system C-terminal sorting domain-containing protein [Polaribacter sp. KT25b]|uniref:T9SS type A sorting domain-containing protein n=1 Tax=Polaribacter sp. KT25b TaxID=1855336 RepID=UPI0008796EB6|nr:T9SS type A sorting domain-containing protein [Polaribacter sp. KT25b]SDS06727.1 Por secretion system C-terminal sorting domain-containing protein [Polaribacter sp. KT25b]
MKKTLLIIALFSAFLGYSQTFDNIPTGSGYYINKLIPSPSGSDLTNEYIEIRGAANAVVPSDLYLISIEGDGNSSSRGKVSEAIQLGDGTLTFGANGMLVVITNYTDTDDNSLTESPYKSVISSDATVIEIALTGTDVTSSSSSAVVTKTPDIGYDGNLIDATATYMLISAPSNPKGVRIDGSSNSDDANGVINDTGDHTSWVLYDSVGYGDDDDVDASENGEFLYGQIVYVQDNASFSSKHFITTSATIVDFATTSDANYILRQGTKTGFTADDWIVSANGSDSSVPNWVFSTSSSKVYPDEFLGWEGIKDVYGLLNPTAASLSVNDVFSSKISVYPNPATSFVKISTSEKITGVEMYNLIGKKVLNVSSLSNEGVDVSNLSKGVYVLKVTSNNLVGTRKVIIE